MAACDGLNAVVVGAVVVVVAVVVVEILGLVRPGLGIRLVLQNSGLWMHRWI